MVELELAVASGGFHDAAAEVGAVGDAEEQIPIAWESGLLQEFRRAKIERMKINFFILAIKLSIIFCKLQGFN